MLSRKSTASACDSTWTCEPRGAHDAKSDTLNVPFVLGNRVDFAQLVKNFGPTQSTVRYSPAKITGAEKIPQMGNPDEDRICTSHVERLNLTVRMNLRQFTRLTNGHSKSLKHHVAMQAILFAWYNFSRVHTAIKKTPAVASGVTDKAWTIKELAERAAESLRDTTDFQVATRKLTASLRQ